MASSTPRSCTPERSLSRGGEACTAADPQSLRGRFAEIAAATEEAIDLGEAAALIGLEDEGGGRVVDVLGALDGLAEDARAAIRCARSPADRLDRLRGIFAEEWGFSGNEGDYYDPANSCLHRVLERRIGIPISLSVVLIEVARRLEIPLRGVGFPTHFLVASPELPGVFIDPFHGGLCLTETECVGLLARLTRGRAPVDARCLQPVSKRYILGRMLNNLKAIYLSRGEYERAIAALDRLLLLSPSAAALQRERGLLRLHVHDYSGAIADLEVCLAGDVAGEDAGEIEALISAASRRLMLRH